MNKREWTMLVGLCGVLAVVLVAGEIRAKTIQQQQYQDYLHYRSTAESKSVSSGTNTQPTQVTPSAMSSVNFLTKVEKQMGSARLVVIGSSGTKGIGVTNTKDSWYNLLVAELRKEPGLRKLETKNLGVYGATTSTLLGGTTLDEAIQYNPNLVLLETCSLTDWYQGIPAKTSQSNLKKIVNKLQDALPNARIVLYSPNPIQDKTNSLNLTYADYLDDEKAEIVSNGWNYIDVYGSMDADVQNGTYQLSNLLTGLYYPNVTGHRLWEQAMIQGLKQGTSSVN